MPKHASSLLFLSSIISFKSAGTKNYWPTEGKLPNLYRGEKSRMKQLEWCFLCGRKECEFLCEKVQSGRCFRQI